MFEFESSGKTINDAIEKGLKELNLNKDDVDIKILQNARLFKKAKILLVVEDEIANKNETIINIKNIKALEEKIKKEEQIIKQQKEEIAKKEALEQVSTDVIAENKNKNFDEIDFVNIAKNFVKGIVVKADLVAEVTAQENEDYIQININGEKVGKLIGKNGNTMASIQFLTNILLNNISRKTKRVFLDIDNYKKRKEKSLEELAHRLAKRIEETGRSMELEPMNSFERRVIHNIIANYPDLKSFSEGEEPRRHLIISLKEETK